MGEKKYPTRMHEVLGVESRERFTYSDYGDREFMLSESGLLYGAYDDGKAMSAATQGTLVLFINHPERITRRLSEEQVKMLKAAYDLHDARWLGADKNKRIKVFVRKPMKDADGWYDYEFDLWWLLRYDTPLSTLVSWSDPEPLDIVATLKAAGVEVE